MAKKAQTRKHKLQQKKNTKENGVHAHNKVLKDRSMKNPAKYKLNYQRLNNDNNIVNNQTNKYKKNVSNLQLSGTTKKGNLHKPRANSESEYKKRAINSANPIKQSKQLPAKFKILIQGKKQNLISLKQTNSQKTQPIRKNIQIPGNKFQATRDRKQQLIISHANKSLLNQTKIKPIKKQIRQKIKIKNRNVTFENANHQAISMFSSVKKNQQKNRQKIHQQLTMNSVDKKLQGALNIKQSALVVGKSQKTTESKYRRPLANRNKSLQNQMKRHQPSVQKPAKIQISEQYKKQFVQFSSLLNGSFKNSGTPSPRDSRQLLKSIQNIQSNRIESKIIYSTPCDNPQYQVQRIVSSKITNGQIQYQVKWINYPSSQNTYQPVSNLKKVMDMIVKFQRNQKRKFQKLLIQKQKEINQKNKQLANKQKQSEDKIQVIQQKNKKINTMTKKIDQLNSKLKELGDLSHQTKNKFKKEIKLQAAQSKSKSKNKHIAINNLEDEQSSSYIYYYCQNKSVYNMSQEINQQVNEQNNIGIQTLLYQPSLFKQNQMQDKVIFNQSKRYAIPFQAGVQRQHQIIGQTKIQVKKQQNKNSSVISTNLSYNCLKDGLNYQVSEFDMSSQKIDFFGCQIIQNQNNHTYDSKNIDYDDFICKRYGQKQDQEEMVRQNFDREQKAQQNEAMSIIIQERFENIQQFISHQQRYYETGLRYYGAGLRYQVDANKFTSDNLLDDIQLIEYSFPFDPIRSTQKVNGKKSILRGQIFPEHHIQNQSLVNEFNNLNNFKD